MERLLYILLWPVSCIYRLIIWLRNIAYGVGLFKTHHAQVPVISVGNITVGGTGKTPVVDALVKHLSSLGKKVAIVSRGYRGSFTGDFGRVTPDGSGDVKTAAESGDEPFLLAARNPDVDVYVARKKRYGVAAAEARGADCIVLDDAFQHLAVARDLDIVLLDSRAPVGNGSLLPAGNLRESPSALNRAGLLIFTHAEKPAMPLPVKVDTVSCRHRFSDHLIDPDGHKVTWAQVIGKRCLAFAGIARPTDFFDRLRERGCTLEGTIPLADHQGYTKDVNALIRRSCKDIDYLLTTEKDFVKLRDVTFPVPCLAVPLRLEFDDFAVIEKVLNRAFGGSNA